MSMEQLAISSLGISESQPEDTVTFPSNDPKKLAWLDIREGIEKWHIWFMLASQDIKLRYRRSVLGPFWITLSMAITVYSMGYLYAHLFKIDMDHYYPFLVAGMLGWSLLLTLVLDYTDGFLAVHGLIRQIKLPYTLHIHRIAARNLLIFFHNLLVMVPIFIIFHKNVPINWCTLLLLPALAIIYLNAICFGMLIAMISARYRDISQIIKSMMQVIFFITPVMWQPGGLQGDKQLIAELNPFYAFLELIRQPLLGNTPTLKNIIVVSIVTLIGLVMSFRLFTRCRARIIYWL